MKIGIFVDTFYPMVDGVINVINSVCSRLVKYADVTVFAPSPSKGSYDDQGLEYKVVRCRSVKPPLLRIDYDLPVPRRDKGFMMKLENADLDLVHIHSPFGVGKAGLRYSKRRGIPSVITLHSQYKQDFYQNTRSHLLAAILTKHIMRVFNACDECWSVNLASKSILHDYGVRKEPIVMENGADMLPLDDLKGAEKEIRTIHGIKQADRIFLFVGRLVPLKNVPFILDALKLLKEKGFGYKMIIVGDGAEGDIIKNKTESLALNDDVIFTGRISDRLLLAKYYAAADLFLFPSFYDTDGVVKREAACQLTPIVCVEGSIVAKSVNSENAFISKNDAGCFADEILRATFDTALYDTVRRNAKRDLYLTWDNHVRNAFERYEALIKATRNKKR